MTLTGLTPEEYQAPARRTPQLSQSVAKTLLLKSPYHAWLSHPLLGNVRGEATDEQERGTLVHQLVLGAGDNVVAVNADDWRTKAAREERDRIREAGKTPVLRHKIEDARAVADAIIEALHDLRIDLTGQSEASIEWNEPGPYGDVECRGMFDHVIVERGVIYDLKTTASAHPAACARTTYTLGYDIQAAAYTSAFRRLRPEMAGRERFVFLFAEELPPGASRRAIVTAAELTGEFMELGRRRWERAVAMWAECLRDDHWPAYDDRVIRMEPPGWAMKEESDHG